MVVTVGRHPAEDGQGVAQAQNQHRARPVKQSAHNHAGRPVSQLEIVLRETCNYVAMAAWVSPRLGRGLLL
ncbi:hypothetical protein [Levilactobacillus zymae]|uniref:hypothetical protein n=1 Tax=Levilactobacillus zymae TaxID=267363 RepID=UPI000B4053BC|nr:hypothetical protein [Levilactobacillus zymae]